MAPPSADAAELKKKVEFSTTSDEFEKTATAPQTAARLRAKVQLRRVAELLGISQSAPPYIAPSFSSKIVSKMFAVVRKLKYTPPTVPTGVRRRLRLKTHPFMKITEPGLQLNAPAAVPPSFSKNATRSNDAFETAPTNAAPVEASPTFAANVESVMLPRQWGGGEGGQQDRRRDGDGEPPPHTRGEKLHLRRDVEGGPKRGVGGGAVGDKTRRLDGEVV